MSDRAGEALVLLLILLLPLSALLARRMPGATMVRYAVAWGLVFVALFALVKLFT
ncbi:hypothetical protein [Sphingomonas sp. BK235]|jgi:hypothetical protein|uniref:hypothetical protein n=1 Tax=Sphingomonas sp. BK235 TaxID=2512131 RepID=UPI0010E7D44D|nr:hypothetical protein [Sphingomonas sp. BK235]TCP37409.1 hypothetical protein EV292_101930 [Sphingomonas sp. BK235]